LENQKNGSKTIKGLISYPNKPFNGKLNVRFKAPEKGNATVSVYSKEFSQEYHKRLNNMVERRLRASIIAIGSIWYTAWVDAGQPDLNTLRNQAPSPALLLEIQELDAHFHNDKHFGRICD